jgi:hypothetical protein
MLHGSLGRADRLLPNPDEMRISKLQAFAEQRQCDSLSLHPATGCSLVWLGWAELGRVAQSCTDAGILESAIGDHGGERRNEDREAGEKWRMDSPEERCSC